MRAVLSFAGLILALHGAPALACGHCVEDKIAAVYDHSIITQALAHKRQVVFFAIEGSLPVNDATKKTIEAAVTPIEGIEKNSVKVSVELAALSFVFDPKRKSFSAIQKSLDKNMAEKKLTVLLMKVMDQPEKIKTGGN